MKLLLKFKEKPHLNIRNKISELVEKYALDIEEIFETPGRIDPSINIVVRVKADHLEKIKLDLKRIPSVHVTEKH